MIYVLLFAFLLRWLGFSATNLSERNAAYVPLVYAIPLVTCAGVGFMLATNRQLQMPRIIGRSISQLTGAVRRLMPFDTKAGGSKANGSKGGAA
jgi:lipopolysaccharide export system permease protein